MSYAIVRNAQTSQNVPQSPSEGVWADCLAQELIDEGTGYFTSQHFYDVTTLPGLPSSVTGTGTFTQASTFDHVLVMTTATAAANDFAQIYTRPLGTVGNGQPIWMEASISVGDITNAKGIFVGLASSAGAVPANTSAGSGIVTAASATRASNTIGPAKTSLIGFWLHGDILTNFDAVYGSGLTNAAPNTSTLTASNGNSAGTLNTVLLNVLTANANNPDPGNPNYTPPAAPGALIVTGTNGQTGINTGSAGFVKLGTSYDGNQYIRWFVNGFQVAKYAVDSTVDQVSSYGGVVCIDTGVTTANCVLNVDFFKAAAKIF